jgi:hypothetical protein
VQSKTTRRSEREKRERASREKGRQTKRIGTKRNGEQDKDKIMSGRIGKEEREEFLFF